jgi:hypothetical protein
MRRHEPQHLIQVRFGTIRVKQQQGVAGGILVRSETISIQGQGTLSRRKRCGGIPFGFRQLRRQEMGAGIAVWGGENTVELLESPAKIAAGHRGSNAEALGLETLAVGGPEFLSQHACLAHSALTKAVFTQSQHEGRLSSPSRERSVKNIIDCRRRPEALKDIETGKLVHAAVESGCHCPLRIVERAADVAALPSECGASGQYGGIAAIEGQR